MRAALRITYSVPMRKVAYRAAVPMFIFAMLAGCAPAVRFDAVSIQEQLTDLLELHTYEHIYRDVVYNRETEFEDMAELIISKQRNGPTGTVKLQFNSRFAQFTDWDRDDAYAGAPGSGLGPTLAPSSFDGDF